MFCLTNKTTNMCTSIMAADGTPCGHRQVSLLSNILFMLYNAYLLFK